MKTYSACFLTKDINNVNNGKPYWITNWYQNNSLDDFDWDKIKKYAIREGLLAYGYTYGENSNSIRSKKNRTIIENLENEVNDNIRN